MPMAAKRKVDVIPIPLRGGRCGRNASGVDQVMSGQCRLAGYNRVATPLNGSGEIFENALMPFVDECHRIGTATGAACFAKYLAASVAPVNVQLARKPDAN